MCLGRNLTSLWLLSRVIFRAGSPHERRHRHAKCAALGAGGLPPGRVAPRLLRRVEVRPIFRTNDLPHGNAAVRHGAGITRPGVVPPRGCHRAAILLPAGLDAPG